MTTTETNDADRNESIDTTRPDTEHPLGGVAADTASLQLHSVEDGARIRAESFPPNGSGDMVELKINSDQLTGSVWLSPDAAHALADRIATVAAEVDHVDE